MNNVKRIVIVVILITVCLCLIVFILLYNDIAVFNDTYGDGPSGIESVVVNGVIVDKITQHPVIDATVSLNSWLVPDAPDIAFQLTPWPIVTTSTNEQGQFHLSQSIYKDVMIPVISVRAEHCETRFGPVNEMVDLELYPLDAIYPQYRNVIELFCYIPRPMPYR